MKYLLVITIAVSLIACSKNIESQKEITLAREADNTPALEAMLLAVENGDIILVY